MLNTGALLNTRLVYMLTRLVQRGDSGLTSSLNVLSDKTFFGR